MKKSGGERARERAVYPRANYTPRPFDAGKRNFACSQICRPARAIRGPTRGPRGNPRASEPVGTRQSSSALVSLPAGNFLFSPGCGCWERSSTREREKEMAESSGTIARRPSLNFPSAGRLVFYLGARAPATAVIVIN